MEKKEDFTLSSMEKKYIEIFGNFYEDRGFPNVMGQIYALLAYKAKSPEEGFNQQEIAEYINRSVSTASRLLNKLVDMRYCDYIEVINDNDRRERKYFMNSNIKEIASRRFNKIIEENLALKTNLEHLERNIQRREDINEEELLVFLQNMEEQIEKLIGFYEKLVGLSQKML